jgi:SAM-dependent methyltransferase
VLEVAAGTGVVTRALVARVPASTTIVASDLNAPMLGHAQALLANPRITWRQADAMALPFEDGAFDAVVCQFGAMFFPNKARAFAEARRVLAPGGRFLFNVWDRIETNDVPAAVIEALARLFPSQPPDFLARVPHGYHDIAQIRRDLAAAGFTAAPRIETLAFTSRAPSARAVASAFCQGTPMRNEIEAHDASALERVTDAVTAALVERYGSGPVEGRIQAHVVEIAA